MKDLTPKHSGNWVELRIRGLEVRDEVMDEISIEISRGILTITTLEIQLELVSKSYVAL